MSLREAAAVIFVLVALLPLLLFVAVISSSGLISKMEAQFAAFMAVFIACLGFIVFRRMVDQISRLAVKVQLAPGEAAAASDVVSAPERVPGLGHVSEIGQLAGAFQQMLDDLRASTQRLEDLVFKLGTLNELVELSARSPKIEDLLPSFLQTTMRAVHAGAGSIMLLDQDNGLLRPAASRGLPDEITESAEVTLGEGIAGKVAELGDAIVIESMEKDARFTQVKDSRQGSGSFLCMPLRAGDRVVGVMSLVRKEDAGTTPPPPPARSALPISSSSPPSSPTSPTPSTTPACSKRHRSRLDSVRAWWTICARPRPSSCEGRRSPPSASSPRAWRTISTTSSR